jgi:Flp pilus assembly protein TadG
MSKTSNFVNLCGRMQRGVAAVELAFVLVILLLITAGVIGFGRVFWYADALTKATRDGARYLSIQPINSSSSAKAKDITVVNSNAANISPPLLYSNVHVECSLSASPSSFTSCAEGVTPANVRVRITGFSVAIGEWFPFIGEGGLINYGSIGLSPHTTMRYMN